MLSCATRRPEHRASQGRLAARAPAWLLGWVAALLCAGSMVPCAAAVAEPLPVVVDLDIGDDIDDSFALALLLASPRLQLLGISTAWGDTALRVRLVHRLLRETGHAGIPVFEGVATPSTTLFSQARWAAGPSGRPPAPLKPADGRSVDALLQLARRQPGQVTLLALGPLTNLAAAIDRDPQGFRLFRQVVMMGGSVRTGYGQSDYRPPRPPDREYNIVSDPAAAQSLFASGVPIVMMPLDATLVRLDDQRRAALFSQGSAMTDALALMYLQWTHGGQPWASATPTLFDVVPVAWLLNPQRCPTTPLRIEVSDAGDTREVAGAPNAQVCLSVDKTAVLEDLMQALLR